MYHSGSCLFARSGIRFGAYGPSKKSVSPMSVRSVISITYQLVRNMVASIFGLNSFFFAKGVPTSLSVRTLHPHPSCWSLYRVQADLAISVCHVRVTLKVVFRLIVIHRLRYRLANSSVIFYINSRISVLLLSGKNLYDSLPTLF